MIRRALVAVVRWPLDVLNEVGASLEHGKTIDALLDEIGPTGEPLDEFHYEGNGLRAVEAQLAQVHPILKEPPARWLGEEAA